MSNIAVKDMIGRTINVPPLAQRIVSLVPSLTELLYDLKLNDRVVGITKFCVKPEKWFKTKTRIGGTKMVDHEKIRLLRPDLIIANKEENSREDILLLSREYPVWVSDVRTTLHAFDAMIAIGRMTGSISECLKLGIKYGEDIIRLSKKKLKQYDVAYLIWRDPWMAVGSDTYIDSLMALYNLRNVCSHMPRYPEVALEDLALLKPRLVLLPSEPYPFREKDVREIKYHLPDAKVMLVDGEMFSWYGSRQVHFFRYFKTLDLG